MPPSDDRVGGGAGPGTSGPQDLDTLFDFTRTLAPARGAAGAAAGAGASRADMSRADVLRGHGLPVGLTVPSIQLAHALELLTRRPRRTDPRRPDQDFPEDPDLAEDAEEARRLVADALASLAGSSGLSVPMGALTQSPAPTAVDPEVEAVFVEFDMAREAWRALPPSAEAWQPHPDVDRYLAAEDAVLNLTDGNAVVLSRQAGLLLELADELADQMGPAAANAIANVAQGLLLRLRR